MILLGEGGKCFKKEEVFNCVRCYLEVKKGKYRKLVIDFGKMWLFEKHFNSYIPFLYCPFLPYIRGERNMIQGHKPGPILLFYVSQEYKRGKF